MDLSAIFRVWNAKYSSFTYFGLDHASSCCLGQVYPPLRTRGNSF